MLMMMSVGRGEVKHQATRCCNVTAVYVALDGFLTAHQGQIVVSNHPFQVSRHMSYDCHF